MSRSGSGPNLPSSNHRLSCRCHCQPTIRVQSRGLPSPLTGSQPFQYMLLVNHGESAAAPNNTCQQHAGGRRHHFTGRSRGWQNTPEPTGAYRYPHLIPFSVHVRVRMSGGFAGLATANVLMHSPVGTDRSSKHGDDRPAGAGDMHAGTRLRPLLVVHIELTA
jgi:hypothetical protein